MHIPEEAAFDIGHCLPPRQGWAKMRFAVLKYDL